MKTALDEMSPIGIIATKYGVTLRALRFYEEKGLLNPVRVGEHRLYDQAAEAQLRKILEAKRLGFSISMIRQKVPLSRWDITQSVDKDFLREKLQKLRHEEQELRITISKIEELLKNDTAL